VEFYHFMQNGPRALVATFSREYDLRPGASDLVSFPFYPSKPGLQTIWARLSSSPEGEELGIPFEANGHPVADAGTDYYYNGARGRA